jgi:hypothetical protein
MLAVLASLKKKRRSKMLCVVWEDVPASSCVDLRTRYKQPSQYVGEQ